MIWSKSGLHQEVTFLFLRHKMLLVYLQYLCNRSVDKKLSSGIAVSASVSPKWLSDACRFCELCLLVAKYSMAFLNWEKFHFPIIG
jgi:hypothetical protein